MHGLFWEGCSDLHWKARNVGVHTVHHDQELHTLLRQLLKEYNDFGVEFVHLDPAKLFSYASGRVSTPQQTDVVYQQLTTMDVGIIKQSGCVSEWWFCSRWKTGQRLVNLLSVGVPAIVYGDAQGHLDVVRGIWPPDGPGKAESYPSDLVVQDDRGVAK